MSDAKTERKELFVQLGHARRPPLTGPRANRDRAAAILRAADLKDKVRRRLQLRRLAMPHLEAWSKVITQVMHLSPIVGDGEHQINIARTVAGYRDSLSNETLMAIAWDDTWVPRSLRAILDPEQAGTKNGASKTGFRFGHPAAPEITVQQLRKNLECIATTTTGEETDMSTSNLERIRNVYRICLNDGYPQEGILEGIQQVWPGLHRDFPEVFYKESIITSVLRHIVEGLDISKSEIPDGYFDDLHARELRDRTKQYLADKPTTGTADETDGKAEGASDLREPGEYEAKVIDVVLASQGLPPIREMVRAINTSKARILDLEEEVGTRRSVSLTMAALVTVEAKGDIPKGNLVTMKAYEAMGLVRGKDAFDFDVPVWEWEHEHPHVPAKDEDYIFQPFVLLRALYALVTNQRSWIYGHTGTGKSTLVEQICARLNWPMARVNFDSEITRLDLVGRETLREEGGTTVSVFVEGILPQAMQQPVVMLMDEMDYIRPDVSYVLQRVTEGNGLLLTEDGGRLVRPHPMFRIMATANTQGQGDEYGMYAGARQQSMAFLDRFTSWIEVEYLTLEQRKTLLEKRVPDLSDDLREGLARYSEEHIEAFKQGKVMQPLSPRGMIEAGRALATFTSILPKASRRKAIEQALGTVLLDRATPQDRAVLRGIADRVFP